jgi:hypothetical protein
VESLLERYCSLSGWKENVPIWEMGEGVKKGGGKRERERGRSLLIGRQRERCGGGMAPKVGVWSEHAHIACMGGGVKMTHGNKGARSIQWQGVWWGGGDFLRRERGTFTRYTFKNEVKNIYVNTDNI